MLVSKTSSHEGDWATGLFSMVIAGVAVGVALQDDEIRSRVKAFLAQKPRTNLEPIFKVNPFEKIDALLFPSKRVGEIIE